MFKLIRENFKNKSCAEYLRLALISFFSLNFVFRPDFCVSFRSEKKPLYF